MLKDYRKNYYSQNGEDGIVDRLFDLLNITDGTMVEFGAWDGKHLSNTRYHYEKRKNLSMVLIESNDGRFEQLQANYANDPRVLCLHNSVSSDANDGSCLHCLLNNKITGDFQLLSIDVDGPDFEIWKAMDKSILRPKIVIIEYNMWVSESHRHEMCNDFLNNGYKLVCVTGNFIFVRQEYEALLSEEMSKDSDFHFYDCNHVDLELFLNRINQEQYDAVLRENRTWVLRNPTEDVAK